MSIIFSKKQQAFAKDLLNPFKFYLFTGNQVPMGFVAGMKLTAFNDQFCQTTIPFKWLNKNPFKSIYFAVQSMAAELSTATPCLVAIQGHRPSVAFIIVETGASFPKKATGKVTFTCENVTEVFSAVDQCIKTQESQIVKCKTVGKMADGTIVSEFFFTWSFKQRSK